MYNCFIHGWSSHHSTCPACGQVVTTSGTIEVNKITEFGPMTEKELKLKFNAPLYSHDECQAKYEAARETIERLTIENVKLKSYALDSVDEKIHLDRVNELKKQVESALKMCEEMAETIQWAHDQCGYASPWQIKFGSKLDKYRELKRGMK